MRRSCRDILYLFIFAALWPTSALAGPWTRDQGHGYLGLSYGRIAAAKLFFPDGVIRESAPYVQQAAQFYGEIGLIDRWLTASIEWQPFRYSQLTDQGGVYGSGDIRMGFSTGIITKPVRLTSTILLGLPIGDPLPTAGPGAAPEAELIARSLPTGDGEADVELRLSLGYSFGRVKKWPLDHFLVIEAGYWWRTRSFDHRGNLLDSDFFDALTYKFELGTKLPWKFIDRFWFIFHMPGLVSLAMFQQGGAVPDARATSCSSGLGNGVSYFAYGFEIAANIYKGLGASFGYDSAFAARCVAAGANLKLGMSYEF